MGILYISKTNCLHQAFRDLFTSAMAQRQNIRSAIFTVVGGKMGVHPLATSEISPDLFLTPVYMKADTRLAINLQADTLEWLISQIVKKDPAAQIDLVGFSLGGLVASYWGSHNGLTSANRAHIHSIIAVESPLGGIPMASQCVDESTNIWCAVLILPKFGGELLHELQMPGYLPGSIVDELPEVARAYSFTSIQSKSDYITNGISILVDALIVPSPGPGWAGLTAMGERSSYVVYGTGIR